MALTRITQGVIEPNQNYDTHNINSTGIVTATGLNISGNASIGGVLTYEDVTNIDSIGIITARSGVDVDDFLSVGSNIHLGNAGVVTATSFVGDGSNLTGLSADKIFEGNTKAEVTDTGSNGRFFVETEGAEKFSIDSVGNFTFNKAHDNLINADGDITIDYKTSGALKIRNFTKSGGFYFYPMNDNYPFVIGYGFGSDEVEIYRTGEVKVGSGITLSGSTGNIIATGIVTASNFVGDGSSLTNILVSSDAQFNTVAGTDVATTRTVNSVNNTLVGYQAGKSIFNSDSNVAVGYRALKDMASGGNYNVCVGEGSAEQSTNGSYNSFLGNYSGWNVNSEWNVAAGYQALRGNSSPQVTGDKNVALGGRALYNVSSGANNIGIGYGVGYGNNGDVQLITGSNNILIGFEAAPTSTSVSNEITLGNSSITKLRVPGIGITFSTNGNHISGVTTFTGEIHGNGQRLGSLSGGGRFSGLFLTNGYSYYGTNKLFVADGNGFGLDAYGSNDAWLKANSGGGSSGDCWMKTGGSGGHIIAKGAGAVELHHAGQSDKKLETVSGGVNIVGSLTVNGAALQSGITGIDTTGTSHFNNLSVSGIATFSGTEAIFNRVSFPQNPGNKTIVGNMAGGSGPTGSEITVVGYAAGYASSGNRLTAIGRMSGPQVSGTDNTCIGYEAGYSNLGAQKNVFVGKDAGMGNKTGSNNIVVGSDAGEGVWNNANYSNSVILGAEAGATLTSSNSNVIVIGYDAEPSSNSVTNEITLGNSSINHLRVPGIGVTFATSGNHVTGITTFSSHVKIPDAVAGNDYASLYLGDGNDVRFFHNGQHTFWQHKLGTPNNGGSLHIDAYGSGGMYLRSGDGGTGVENAIRLNNNGSVDLYYSGTKKLETTSGGVNVIGSLTVNGSAISGGGGGVTSDSEENTVGGTDAGAALDSDTYRNTLFGFDTGKVINSGDDNTIMGWKAGDAITSGYKNCAVGSEALPNCNSGHNNVAMGWEAGRSLTSGNNNVCLGPMAGRSLGGGTYNIALGYHALSNVGSPTRCIGIGGDSIFLGGTDVIGIGQGTMMRGNSQIGGIGIGRYAGRNNAGDHNVYIGYEAGYGYGSSSPYSTGNYNVSMGYHSLYDIKEGHANVAIGASAGKNVNDGFGHVLIGVNAGIGVTTEQQSVYIGYEAAENTHKGRQVAIGWRALRYTGNSTPGYRGNNHTAIGNNCMSNLSIYSNYNTAVGDAAMQNATAGFNAAFGYGALRNGGGEINTALGMNALNNTSGSWNCAIGYNAGDDCTGGSKNCLLGVYAGEDIGSGSHNVCLGAYSTVSASGVSNECVIGAPSGHASEINHVRIPGIGVSFSDGGAVISGVVTATSFVGDGSGLTGLSGGALSVDANNNFTAGTSAGGNLTSSAFSNLFIGYEAGKDTTGGDNNIALGSVALEENQGGNYNVAIGPSALKRCVSGGANIAIGSGAGQKTTGSNNVFYGFEAGYNNTSGTNNVYLGKEAGSSTNSGSNNIVIGSGANPSSSAVSNEITLGDANITNFRIPGVHIGITANATSLPAAIFRPGVIQETVHNYTSAITGTYNHDILSYGMVWNGTANASGAFTFNIRGDASTTFNSLTSTGKVTTMTIYSTNNNASNYMSAFQIDGSTQTVKWAGGSAPSAATGSGVDVYSLTIMKTAANTYDVFGNVTNFA